jgi:hypothetical protein
MLLLNPDLLISVTFSTTTPVNNSFEVGSTIDCQRQVVRAGV